MQNPRWTCPAEFIDGFKSSITFAFEDPDGSDLKSLLKTNLFMFGAPVISLLTATPLPDVASAVTNALKMLTDPSAPPVAKKTTPIREPVTTPCPLCQLQWNAPCRCA
ncbi:hypothetical protein BDR04DRAFT_1165271 [Suillus decipiens]|nr:hypothetical protein BDR04DRAFT_1165271 [Suillus decipiens]